MRFFLLAFLVSLFILPACPRPASALVVEQAAFELWLADFRAQAAAQGISPEVLQASLAGVEFSEKVIELDRKQPEHKVTIEEYLQKTISQRRIKNGRGQLAENQELLREIERKYQVPADIIVSLWGMETSYGENAGGFNVINSLATLAYEGRRSEFFRLELLNALWIVEAGDVAPEDFTGSWAGAFGQCQFMPSSFLKYAVDYDGDGRRDIWGTNADIFASIANYLHSEGWNKNGVVEEGSNNFNVLLKWNRSRYFATAVGKLAQHITQ